MAVISKLFERLGMGASAVHRWPAMKANDTGQPASIGSSAALCAQVLGVLGEGGKVVIQGSNAVEPTDVDWSIAVDRTGFAAEFVNLDNLKLVDGAPRWVRPVVYGDATTLVNVALMIRGDA